MNDLTPAELFAPGEHLREELEVRGWTQAEFAEILGRPPAVVSEIINGRRAITPATAKELAAALGTSPMLWLNLESRYQLHRSEDPPRRISVEAKLRGKYPIREMARRGWIEYSESPDVLQQRVLRFFEIHDLHEEPVFRYAAMKTGDIEGYDRSSPTQLAWLFRVRQMAQALQAPLFSARKLRGLLRDLRQLMIAPEEARHVPRILHDAGVRFVIVEPLPGSKIDGVCFWLNENQPVIGMSLRFDRIDNFWFVLRHEIEHVLQGHASVDSDLKMDPHGLSEQERLASEAAAEFAVAAKNMDDFIARKSPLFSRNRVVNFSRLVQVHPGIVAGQLQYRLDRYDLLRPLLVKIRSFVVPSAFTDGYGHVAPV